MKSAKSSRTRMTPMLPPKTPSRSNSENLNKDAVRVFCRLRPMNCDADLTCFRVKSDKTVVVSPPEMAINYKISCLKETEYSFQRIFDKTICQRDVYRTVAQPLVENLIRGKNGLLFTYGVTGSGKTYTMTGNIEHQGIMPRCLDELFKTIADYQTKKFIFKPDRLNGFEILSDADAMLERQTDMNARFNNMRSGLARKMSDTEVASQASGDVSILNGIDEDNMYAVFITYIEVYNNSVYDLLEESSSIVGGGQTKTMQSKIIREDSQRNMFVHGVTEIEVKSIHEAIDYFQMGQKRKRMGHTVLNAESSRSHSVFTIRLVQAPTDSQGEAILQDRRTIVVSQLSLVDLAGSERTNRTKNTGQRLREASNINNSLLTLRTCMEILRENQQSSSVVPKKVPYREAKITHLFKNYFDGEGQIRMIVCINPRAEDYDESVQVMKFAEMTQEVIVTRPTPILNKQISNENYNNNNNGDMTPGRRKANQMFKIARQRIEDMGEPNAKKLDVDIGLVYSLGPNFPEYKLDSPECAEIIEQLQQHLEQRIQKRKILLEDYNARQSNFRMHLMKMEKDSIKMKTDNQSLQAMIEQQRNKMISVENLLRSREDTIDELNRKVNKQEAEINELKMQLNQKMHLINQKDLEKEKQRKKYTSRMAVESDMLKREMEQKLKEQTIISQDKLRDQENRIKNATLLLNRGELLDNNITPSVTTTVDSHKISQYSRPKTQSTPREFPTVSTIGTPTPRTHRGIAVANVRHRRSRSAEKWIEHRAANPVQLGTILQPFLPNRKSITKLTDVKDLKNSKTSKYCLTSQAADTDGEVETRLYKGNIIPTTGGGVQVVYNDIELLKQMSPTSPKYPTCMQRMPKRASEETSPVRDCDVATKCSVGIEGHNSAKKLKY